MFQCSDNENWCCATGNVDNFVRNYNFTCCSIEDLTYDLGPAVYYGKATVSIPISTLAGAATSTSATSSTTQTASDAEGTGLSTIDAATFASAATAATSTSTGTAAAAEDSSSSSSKTGLAAGLGVGIPVALILAGLVAWLFYRLGKKQNGQAAAQQQQDEFQKSPEPPIPAYPAYPPYQDQSEGTTSPANEVLVHGLGVTQPAYDSPKSTIHEIDTHQPDPPAELDAKCTL